jgi:hypothetical protein
MNKTSSRAWDCRSVKGPWYSALKKAAPLWSPSPSLRLNADAIRASVVRAADERAGWLPHPCVTAILDEGERACADHARLAVWVAANTQGAELGAMSLDESVWVWSHDGSLEVEAGVHDLATVPAGEVPAYAVPDPWGHSLHSGHDLGDLADCTWWNRGSLSQEDRVRLTSDIRSLLELQRSLSRVLPDAADWVADVTSVIVPLTGSSPDRFRSATFPGLPGAVFVEVTSQPLLTIEALIHESAHLHFHMEETGSPFFVPGHAERYRSPLRPDPRPLRGIFLAYHAMIYMCAFYEDWLRATGDERCAEALGGLRAGRDDAGAVLRGAASGLTDAGRRFLRTCQSLVEDRAVT